MSRVASLSKQLDHIYDLERLMTRTVYGTRHPARDLYALAQHLRSACPSLKQPRGELQLSEVWQSCPAEIDALERYRASRFMQPWIRRAARRPLQGRRRHPAKGYHQEVDELRAIRR